jgi:hypothetical protein
MKRAVVPSILVAVVLLAVGVTAEAQQPTKIPRIGYQSASSSGSARRHFARDYVNSVTSKDRTSSLSGDLHKERPIRFHAMRLS